MESVSVLSPTIESYFFEPIFAFDSGVILFLPYSGTQQDRRGFAQSHPVTTEEHMALL